VNRMVFDMFDETFGEFSEWVKKELHANKTNKKAEAFLLESFPQNEHLQIHLEVKKNQKFASIAIFDFALFEMHVHLQDQKTLPNITFVPYLYGRINTRLTDITFGEIYKHYERQEGKRIRNLYPQVRGGININVWSFKSYRREKSSLEERIAQLEYEIRKRKYELQELRKTVMKMCKYTPITKGVFK